MLKRLLFLVAFILVCILHSGAQTLLSVDEPRAERLFAMLLHNETDSLYAQLNSEVKAALRHDQLEGTMRQVETAVGAYLGHAVWQHERVAGTNVLTTLLRFERGRLKLVFAFDAQGLVSGLRLMPVPQESDEYIVPDGVVEIIDTVRTAPRVALPCVITLSAQPNPPMIVMVHGSGPLDRDETVMANHTFRDLAHQLALHGVCSLRYDKRTFVCQCPVDNMDDETVLDAMSAVSLACQYNNNVYLLGHSLGAMMAPIIAGRSDMLLRGIVMMAAPARDLLPIVREQVEYLHAATADTTDLQAMLELVTAKMQADSPHYLLPQGQVEAARKLSLPKLLLQGGRDYQVPPAELELWRQALGETEAVYRLYPSLNHLFLEGEGPSLPTEYQRSGVIHEQVVNDIVEFVCSHRHN